MTPEKDNQSSKAMEREQCPRQTSMNEALYAIGGKWKLRIIMALSDGNKRFNELQRCIHGISPRVLSDDLKELETNGLIKRNVITGYPVVIEYELMPYSTTLEKVFKSLSEWGAEHSHRVKTNDFSV